MEVKELVQNCAENQGLKSELLVLFWSFQPELFLFLMFPCFSLNSFNKHVKHLQLFRQCEKHLEGLRDADDNSCPPGLCSLVR